MCVAVDKSRLVLDVLDVLAVSWKVSAARQARVVWEVAVGTQKPQKFRCRFVGGGTRRPQPGSSRIGTCRCASFNSGVLRSGRVVQ